MIEAISQDQLQARLGLTPDQDGLPCWAGVTALLRQAVGRWGLSPPDTLNRHVRHTLNACGYEDVADRVQESLRLLCAIGDAELVWADAVPVELHAEGDVEEPETDVTLEVGTLSVSVSGRLVAPTLPRAVQLGQRYLVLGSYEVEGVEYECLLPQEQPSSAARWLDSASLDVLESGGFEVISPARWLGSSSILDHLERREVKGQGVKDLWPALQRALDQGGGPIADPGNVKLLGGAPGGFWGRPAAGDGRWRSVDRAPDGDVLGVMLGRHGKREQPIIARIEQGKVRRALELYDHEELRWAVLSRGVCTNAPERVLVRDGALRFTCPLPAEAQRLRALCSVETWAWSPPLFLAPEELGVILSDRFGLFVD